MIINNRRRIAALYRRNRGTILERAVRALRTTSYKGVATLGLKTRDQL